MYRYLRNTHLFLGLSCCLFLLMYGVSAVQMAHNTWFHIKPATTESRLTLVAQADDARTLAADLMRNHGLKGELTQVRKGPGTLTFSIGRPGIVYQIQYQVATGETKVLENRLGFMGMLNRIHHAGGLWHGYWLINAWGSLVGIVSAALFAISLTGIYLWFMIHNERVIGGILLALSLGYGLTLIALVRAAG